MEKKNKKKMLWKIFISTLYLSAFTFGGGYVIVTLMKKKFVDDYHWIEENEMLDLVAIAQSSPGAIAVNGAIVVGYKLAGILGTIVAIIGTVIPPVKIIQLLMDDIKCCTERITKGYCSKDVDNIDIWFLNIIPDMLQSLMDKKMGVPKEIYDNYENIENGI